MLENLAEDREEGARCQSLYAEEVNRIGLLLLKMPHIFLVGQQQLSEAQEGKVSITAETACRPTGL